MEKEKYNGLFLIPLNFISNSYCVLMDKQLNYIKREIKTLWSKKLKEEGERER